MNISLTPELDDFIRRQVESGLYHSSSEVVRDGLRLLKEREEIRQIRLEEIRKKIAVGIEQANRGEVFTMEEVFNELSREEDEPVE